MADLDSAFSDDGLLAKAIAGYRARPQQIAMAEAVANAIEARHKLVVEAGTGTGKTYAYLVPALLSGGKVSVSTGTKTLQDQLFNRDLPTVRAALKVPVTVALLKGRANYVCHYHLERAQQEGRFLSRDDTRHMQKIVSFARISKSGDKSTCAGVPEQSPVWNQVTSTRDNCLGSDCPYTKECFVAQARKEALAADLVVVNHHLFFADVLLRDEGAGELLPACNTVIFDEAHQLPEVATNFLGEHLGSGQLLELARDSRAEGISGAKDFGALPEGSAKLEKAVKDLRLVFEQDSVRLPAHQLDGLARFAPALAELQEKLEQLESLLESQAERSEGLARCYQRCQASGEQLRRWQQPADDDWVRWIEVFSHGLQLNRTPLAIDALFRKQVEGNAKAWIFTSATLAVDGNFRHFCAELGLDDADTGCWDSPFDYKSQALLYVPRSMPEANSPQFTAAVVEQAWPALLASQGRAFLLFTSLRAMREAYELVKKKIDEQQLDYPLLSQGEGARTELLEKFRKSPNAVLVASQTFWEGIDVRGDALQLVVIDKLPFAPPDDPVLAARVDQMNKAGRNPFMEFQLPRAAITLKQGAGRLIRDETDRGVLMICDTRLVDKPYGKKIWKSLPPMLKTRDADVIQRFFAQLRQVAGNAGLEVAGDSPNLNHSE